MASPGAPVTVRSVRAAVRKRHSERDPRRGSGDDQALRSWLSSGAPRRRRRTRPLPQAEVRVPAHQFRHSREISASHLADRPAWHLGSHRAVGVSSLAGGVCWPLSGWGLDSRCPMSDAPIISRLIIFTHKRARNEHIKTAVCTVGMTSRFHSSFAWRAGRR